MVLMLVLRPQGLFRQAGAVSARAVAIVVALGVLASLPLWMPGTYYVNVASQILLYAVFALGLNVIVGYGGLVSLGHAGLFGIAAYTGAILLQAGAGHAVAIAGGARGDAARARRSIAVLSLRATGIGFVMITLALGQIVWGLAYRWLSLTNGDNGISVASRPAPFGLSLDSAPAVLLRDARRSFSPRSRRSRSSCARPSARASAARATSRGA